MGHGFHSSVSRGWVFFWIPIDNRLAASIATYLCIFQQYIQDCWVDTYWDAHPSSTLLVVWNYRHGFQRALFWRDPLNGLFTVIHCRKGVVGLPSMLFGSQLDLFVYKKSLLLGNTVVFHGVNGVTNHFIGIFWHSMFFCAKSIKLSATSPSAFGVLRTMQQDMKAWAKDKNIQAFIESPGCVAYQNQ